MSRPRAWLVVAAAGVGQRFSADRPKQYVELMGRPIAEWTLASLAQFSDFAATVVAVAEGDAFFSSLSLPQQSQPLHRVAGGDCRAVSVLNALNFLADKASDNDWVMVHDIARPLLTVGAIERLLSAVEGHSVGGILAVPLHDTIKRSERSVAPDAIGVVSKTLDRSHLLAAQTPQVFRYALLRRALREALEQGRAVTDEAAALEAMGKEVLAVVGCAQNIKITRPEDLALAAFYLQQREAGRAGEA